MVVAPNVMRWDQKEKVIVTLSGNSSANVELYMKDWPLTKNTFSRSVRNNTGDGQGKFRRRGIIEEQGK